LVNEKALLVSLDGDSLKEIQELAYTAGAVVCEQVSQHLKRITPTYFMGEGKAKEIAQKVSEQGIQVVLIDEDLSPAQQNNLEELCGVKVIDRTGLILDIFAQRAQSQAGKLQVELAQLNYLLPRLTGHGVAMSRLGGGIGTRGPGETKLEYDRRKIRDRISVLKKELKNLKITRDMHRQKRQGVPLPIVTIVGYTNAGKSTLLNTLTASHVLAEDKLFATLDPTTRKLILPNHQKILLTDTVGFIKKLPVQLVEAFKATLEEVTEADVLLHVIDISQPNFEDQAREVLKILHELGVSKTPTLHVYNKIDACPKDQHVFLTRQRFHPFCVISAEQKIGLDVLLTKVQDLLTHFTEVIEVKLPMEDQKILSQIYSEGQVLEKKYLKNSIRIKASVSHKLANRLKQLYS